MKNILVPISFSETSINALHHASIIAKEHGATLTLLHCYAAQEYNRVYEFKGMDYEEGVKKMLKTFFNENIQHNETITLKFIAYPGSVSNVISTISAQYGLLVLSKKIALRKEANRWISEKIFYSTINSNCPVLILPNERGAYSFSNIKTIWHIERNSNELGLIQRVLSKLKIDSAKIITKTLEQKTFVSEFWQNIVNFSKSHDRKLLDKISTQYDDEEIDLLVVINHRKSIFEKFLKDDAFTIICQYDIPLLVLQLKNAPL